MLAFGIMTLSMESEASYIDEIAIRANSYDIECFRFIPSKINPHTLQVEGRRFDLQTLGWIDCEFPIPPLLYDRCFYGDDSHSKQCIPIVSWLKNRDDLTFLGYGLPNKLELYEKLKNSALAAYLPPSQPIRDSSIVLHQLTKMGRLIIKPINGSQGHGIFYLKKNDKNFHVMTEKKQQIISRIFPDEIRLTNWLDQLMKQRQYLLQPYLELSNNELQPFDIRVLLQKDEQGIWGERGRGIRTGTTGGILSNLSAGGSAIDFAAWANALPPTMNQYICHELDYIISQLPTLLEKEFLPLFEIGIDIGVAKNGAIWILDINSKPGRKVLLKNRLDLMETLARAPLLYGKYLSETGAKERKSNDEKTLYH